MKVKERKFRRFEQNPKAHIPEQNINRYKDSIHQQPCVAKGVDDRLLILVGPEEGVKGSDHFRGFAQRTSDSVAADGGNGSYGPKNPDRK